jgi:hypothetical protein
MAFGSRERTTCRRVLIYDSANLPDAYAPLFTPAHPGSTCTHVQVDSSFAPLIRYVSERTLTHSSPRANP